MRFGQISFPQCLPFRGHWGHWIIFLCGTPDGFKNGTNTDDDYGYWANGVLKYDKNKGIDSIVYNSYLKKISRVKFANGNWENFYYDGAGTLLKRKLSNNDEWIYRDEILQKNGEVYQINFVNL